MPVVTFGKVKVLTVADDGKAKDQDAQLRLEGDGLHVVDAGQDAPDRGLSRRDRAVPLALEGAAMDRP